MAILTANDFAQQMIAQLRVLDPSVSAEIGTPERKIIDTIAQALAENQVDLTGLAGALDIDSKFGANLDRFTQLFGFARQVATAASGYVIFARNSPAPEDILIPTGTIIQSNEATNGIFIQYVTTAGGTIAKDGTSSTPVPVVCTAPGTAGNSAANTLTQMVGALPPIGVTSVTNPAPITDGLNPEDDNVYKVRFKNTVLRNLAGTEDQYLALAVSTAFTTKANVIGPVSKYQEYVQVPDFDDVGRLGRRRASSCRDPNCLPSTRQMLSTSRTSAAMGNRTCVRCQATSSRLCSRAHLSLCQRELPSGPILTTLACTTG
jgi:hypothetical protein